MANNTHATSTTTSPICCRHCDRLLVTISPDGLLQAAPCTQANTAPSCAVCEPFEALYQALQTAEREHQGLMSKRPNHGGRAKAHDMLRGAKVAFENLYLNVHAQVNPGALGAEQAGTGSDKESHDLDTRMTGLGGGSHRGSAQFTQPLSPHSTSVSQARRRIQFTADVPDRDDYRGSDEYCRSHAEYVPGRYTPSEGFEYLDTSGSNQTFLKFTGQRKVRDRWVDVEMKEEVQSEGVVVSNVASGRKKKRGNTEIEAQHEVSGVYTTNDSAMVSSRELRLARRSRERTLDSGVGDSSAPRKRSRSRRDDGQASASRGASTSGCEQPTQPDMQPEMAPMGATEGARFPYQQPAQLPEEPRGILDMQVSQSNGDMQVSEGYDNRNTNQYVDGQAEAEPAASHSVSTILAGTSDYQSIPQRSEYSDSEAPDGSASATLQSEAAGAMAKNTLFTIPSIGPVNGLTLQNKETTALDSATIPTLAVSPQRAIAQIPPPPGIHADKLQTLVAVVPTRAADQDPGPMLYDPVAP